jgi:hypothetical protein
MYSTLNDGSITCFMRSEYALPGVSQILESTGPITSVCNDMYCRVTPSSTNAPEASTLREKYVWR